MWSSESRLMAALSRWPAGAMAGRMYLTLLGGS